MTSPRRLPLVTLLVTAIVLAMILSLVIFRRGTGVSRTEVLSDGSRLTLREIVLTTTNYSYKYEPGGKFLRKIAPVLPASIRNRLSLESSGSFGFGSDGSTKLIAITVHKGFPSGGGSTLARLQVFDDAGNVYDASWGAHTLGLPGETLHGWQMHAFPRRSKELGLRFLQVRSDGSWEKAAEFRIPNPARREDAYPQWTPEPWPSAKADGNLSVTLAEFQSGARMEGQRGKGSEEIAARKTRLRFTFAEDQKPASDWQVQKLTISDATRNRWSPHLDFVNQDFNWARQGTVEFFGALWPGEPAWKLNVELARTAGFSPEQLWETKVALPPMGTVATLTNHWPQDGLELELVALASPGAEHAGDFQWIAKWWGEDRTKVYSLAVELKPSLAGRRLSLVRAIDQEGNPAVVVQHGNQDSPKQALFFKPPAGATEVRLTFALQRSRFVEFTARPEFVVSSSSR